MSRGPNEKPEKEIELENKFENMGAQMVREVASKTSEQAGNGLLIEIRLELDAVQTFAAIPSLQRAGCGVNV